MASFSGLNFAVQTTMTDYSQVTCNCLKLCFQKQKKILKFKLKMTVLCKVAAFLWEPGLQMWQNVWKMIHKIILNFYLT